MDKAEYQKDIHKEGIRDTDTLNLLDTKEIVFFKDNQTFAFCYKKSVKLLKAIYLITDNPAISQNDRNDLRALSQQIVKDVIELGLGENGVGERVVARHMVALQRTTLTLFALLDTLVMVGSVSAMNVAICVNEYQQVLHALMSSSHTTKGGDKTALFAEDFFAVAKGEGLPEVNLPRVSFNSTEHTPQNKGQFKTKGQTVSFKPAQKSPIQISKKGDHFSSNGLVSEESNSAKNQNSERTLLILKEVKEKGSVTIKDISVLMKEVSEKTVQRELIALVSEGVLKKEGERRWSRYLLA